MSELRLEVKNVIIGIETIVCQLRCSLQLNLINLIYNIYIYKREVR